MTVDVDICNRALVAIGWPGVIPSMTQDSEAAQTCNLVYAALRDELIRLAPWNCAKTMANLQFLTAVPGTPENPTIGTTTWQKQFPAPPWTYEYLLPIDLIRALYVVPQYPTGFSGGIPITTAVTGGIPTFWNGPPVRFNVAMDQPIYTTAAAPANMGQNYKVGDNIILAQPTGIDVPSILTVTSVGPSGSVTSVALYMRGSYSATPVGPQAQGSTTGGGTGATFNLTVTAGVDTKVLLTNQEFAILAYLKRVTDPNQWDSQFQEAMISALASRIALPLMKDLNLAEAKLKDANMRIGVARQGDGNEGLTINNVDPDWIRIRGIDYPLDYGWTPNMNAPFDWGMMLTM